jgi:putative flippase GtrA
MSTINQIVKYGFIGILTTSIGYIFYILLSNIVGINPSISAILSGAIITSISYHLNSTYTFKAKDIKKKITLSFYLLYISAIFIHSLIIFIFSNIFNFAHEIVAGISLIIISLSLFLIQKFYLFNK